MTTDAEWFEHILDLDEKKKSEREKCAMTLTAMLGHAVTGPLFFRIPSGTSGVSKYIPHVGAKQIAKAMRKQAPVPDKIKEN